MDKKGDPQVTWEDQQNINAFGRLNTRFQELQQELNSKKRDLEDLEEAGNEIMISDEETIKYSLGEVFLHVDQEEAESRIAATVQRMEADLEVLGEENERVKTRMAELKSILYGKFGSAINLETD